jgi:hypothetical protein
MLIMFKVGAFFCVVAQPASAARSKVETPYVNRDRMEFTPEGDWALGQNKKRTIAERGP